MITGYSAERNVQILLAVLKANHIRKIIVDPGATNVSFVAGVQYDDFFEVYSAVDERGAAYIACGLAAESGEAVVITCTGATASRNYFSGLTEAFHKKLPILAVTASQDFSKAGHLSPQYIDRTGCPADSLRLSVKVPIVRCDTDEWDATIKINKAVLELFRNGGGPVHIDLATSFSNDFSVKEMKPVRVIRRYTAEDTLPTMEGKNRIAVTVGAHKRWSAELTKAVDDFCAKYDAVVLVDHSSAYWGKYRVLPTILAAQAEDYCHLFDIDLLIHIGEEHGDYYTNDALFHAKEVWRVSEDGEIRDTFRRLKYVFEMKEETFFGRYAAADETDAGEMTDARTGYYDAFMKEIRETYALIPELPLSNIYAAQQIAGRIPAGSSLHLGVSNTMRSWTFFEVTKDTFTLANTGCRGIDGAIAAAIGMSLSEPDRLHFAVMGDLTFFYGLNALGNRYLGKNVRILLINNGCGAEFNLYQHRAYAVYDGNKEELNRFVAAGGHYSSASKEIVRHFTEDLGFEYLRAETREEFDTAAERFLTAEKTDKPMVFEVFTDTEQENEALRTLRSLKVDKSHVMKKKIAGILGESGVSALKKIMK